MPRLAVFRSNKDIYAQIINDIDGKTIAAASSKDLKGTKIEQANAVGKVLPKKVLLLDYQKLFLIEVDIFIMVELRL